MNRLFLLIIASVLAFSTIYGSISLGFDGKANSVLVDFTENTECEVDVIDIRLFMYALNAEDWLDVKDRTSMNYSEKLIFINFQEVPNPPPKS